MMNPIVLEKTISDRTITWKRAAWPNRPTVSVIIRCGDTMVLVTAVVTKESARGCGFSAPDCDYLEKTYSAGRIPGGFFKREGRPSEKEVLTSRLIDRPLRPLFPKGFYNETQIIASVLSKDDRHEGDVLAITGASAALHLSQAPFQGPVAAVRVGCLGEELIANPTHEQMVESTLDVVVAANRKRDRDGGGRGQFHQRGLMIKALLFGFNACQPVIDIRMNCGNGPANRKWNSRPPEKPLA
jgi:polyribonucleotide nucleotidyltransferase